MARMREYTTFAERREAYRSRQREAALPPLYLPVLRPLSLVSPTGRWRIAVDLAARLLQTVAEQMQAYSDEQGDHWHEGSSAEWIHENIDCLNDLQAQLDDLRSNF
ncbi:MAG: hypothetical protein ACRD22_16255 [Terriglobia bacterium]